MEVLNVNHDKQSIIKYITVTQATTEIPQSRKNTIKCLFVMLIFANSLLGYNLEIKNKETSNFLRFYLLVYTYLIIIAFSLSIVLTLLIFIFKFIYSK